MKILLAIEDSFMVSENSILILSSCLIFVESFAGKVDITTGAVRSTGPPPGVPFDAQLLRTISSNKNIIKENRYLAA